MDTSTNNISDTALIESRKQYQSLLQSIEGIVWEADAQTFEFSFVSAQSKSILGYTPEEWLSTPDFWRSHIYPEDRDYAVSFCVVQTQMSRNHTFDYRMIKADGNIIWLKDIVSVIAEDGQPKWLRGIMVDITETKLLENLDHLEKEVLELNSKKETDVETVLQFYVRGIESLFPKMKCSILRIENNKLYDWASPSLPRAYVSMINNMEIGPNTGSCGTAAYLREKVIVNDIEHDVKWVAYKHLILPHGLRACWSYPIIDSGGTAIAVLGIYYDTVKTPDEAEQAIIERSAAILKVILENRLYAKMMLEIAWMQSHVIRAPLARLMGLVNLLQEEIRPSNTNEELISHIVHSAHELDDVIKTISEKTYN